MQADVTPGKILNQALKLYFDDYSDVTQIKSGHTNINYTFISNNKKFIIRFYAQDSTTPRTEETISLEINLINLFYAKGIPTAPVTPNKNGALLSRIGSQFFDIFEFINGDKVYGALKSEYFEEVGHAMGKMHKITQQDTLRTDIKWPEGNFWNHVFKLVELNHTVWCKEDLSLIEKLKLAVLDLKLLREYLIHGDFHYGNLLFKENKLVAVLDFDHYRMGHFIDDITRSFVAEIAHTSKQEYWLTQEFVNYFWDGYLKQREINAHESKLVLPYIDLHYLNQLLRLQKENKSKIKEFKKQVEDLKQFTLERLAL